MQNLFNPRFATQFEMTILANQLDDVKLKGLQAEATQ